MMLPVRSCVFAFVGFAMGLAGCVSATVQQGPGATAKPPYKCRFLRVEKMESNPDIGTNAIVDSVVLTLVLTPPGQVGGSEEGAVSAKVLVHKERAADLQAELEAKPDLMCEPEAGSPFYRVTLPEP